MRPPVVNAESQLHARRSTSDIYEARNARFVISRCAPSPREVPPQAALESGGSTPRARGVVTQRVRIDARTRASMLLEELATQHARTRACCLRSGRTQQAPAGACCCS